MPDQSAGASNNTHDNRNLLLLLPRNTPSRDPIARRTTFLQLFRPSSLYSACLRHGVRDNTCSPPTTPWQTPPYTCDSLDREPPHANARLVTLSTATVAHLDHEPHQWPYIAAVHEQHRVRLCFTLREQPQRQPQPRWRRSSRRRSIQWQWRSLCWIASSHRPCFASWLATPQWFYRHVTTLGQQQRERPASAFLCELSGRSQ